MLKNEKANSFEQDPENTIKRVLKEQLWKMYDRAPGREDAKYRILEKFVEQLENSSFEEIYPELSRPEQHAIITRLQNESTSFGGPVPIDFIDDLEEKLYGTTEIDKEHRISFGEKVKLETELQEEY